VQAKGLLVRRLGLSSAPQTENKLDPPWVSLSLESVSVQLSAEMTGSASVVM